MKYATLALLGITVAIGPAIAGGQAPAPGSAPATKGDAEMKTVEQKFAYAYGLNLGRSMKEGGILLDPDLLAKGMKDALADKPAFTEPQLQAIQQEFRKLLMAKNAAAEAPATGGDADKTLKDGQAFLAANKTKPGVVTLPSGVQYKVLVAGKGGKSPKLSDTVAANYKGTLIDGTEFDSSYKRGKPSPFGVGEVIKGWTEVLQLMKVGDKWQVFIPSEMAYGARARGDIIKANSTLIFEMELVEILGSN